MGEIKNEEHISTGRACRILSISRSSYYYASRKDDSAVVRELEGLAATHPTKGFAEYYHRIRKKGIVWNHKKVKRVYNNMQLHIRRKHKRRLPERVKQRLAQPAAMNQSWSLDFMQDSLMSGRSFRTLNILDDCNREILAIEIDPSISGERVKRILEQTIQYRGKPQQIRTDNGPEFISGTVKEFLAAHNIHHHFIQPGKPTQNAYIERLNKTYRRDVLDAYLFENITQVKILTEQWMEDYNKNHPHKSLQYKTPHEYALDVYSGKFCPRTKPATQFSTIHINDDDDEYL